MSLPAPETLSHWAQRALEAAKAAGASSAEVNVSTSRALSVSVRRGEVENVEFQRDRDLQLTVYFGHRVGSAGTADLSDAGLAQTVAAACDIAKLAGEDHCMGLADADLLYRAELHGAPELDLHHPWALTPEQAAEIAKEAEAAAFAADSRVVESEGASVDSREAVGVYANSNGFLGARRGSNHSLSCSVIARAADAEAMHGGYDYASARAREDWQAVAAVGKSAGERAAARIGAASLSTRSAPVLFSAEMARGLIGSMLSAISGGALYRKASFLRDKIDTEVMSPHMSLRQNPFIARGAGSALYDSEGVRAVTRNLVEDGVLRGYLLGSYAARKLGLRSTGNASGAYNVEVSGRTLAPEALFRELGTGLYVTSLMGQGVNTLTGDYSRGAEGFWVENGVISYPVEGITIAGNLATMLRQIVAIGSDLDCRGSIRMGSLLLEQMTIAGD